MAGRRTHLTVATHDLADGDVVLHLGSAHPATHGALRVELTLEDGRVVAAEPIVGYLHRGAEKLFEVRDYRQIIVLANRHDWLSAFANELGVVLAVERMLGMDVPTRAVWIRTLLAELNRVLSHLMFLGTFPAGEPTAQERLTAAMRARERVQGLMEEVSGGRLHYMFNRVGGIKEDLPDGWAARAVAGLADVRESLPSMVTPMLTDADFRRRARGLGALPAEAVLQYGVSGPIARASGVDMDLRRDDPYLAYAEVGDRMRVVTRTEGDVLARLELLAEQITVSLDIAEACLEQLVQLAPGPVNLKLPKVVRAPEGSTYAWTENPLGINGYYLVSRGEKTPWRLKLRSASFNNVQVLGELLVGAQLDEVALIVASVFYVAGDIDK